MPEAAFVIAGEGELLDGTRALGREMGIVDDIYFMGRCDAIAELLAASAVCVLSSRSGEGFSNAILEYMAAGRPVVATDVAGAREAVVDGETGYIVPAGDDEAMAGRIAELLGDPERARAMGENGRCVARIGFSCEAQLARVEGLYDQLLSLGPDPSPGVADRLD
jgi:glycosyltransferase involved in cell wall biosynthesis